MLSRSTFVGASGFGYSRMPSQIYRSRSTCSRYFGASASLSSRRMMLGAAASVRSSAIRFIGAPYTGAPTLSALRFSTSASNLQSQQPQPVSMKKLSESFLDGTSATYVESMYEAWKTNPGSVHVSWDTYFRSVDQGVVPGEAYQSPPTLHGATRSGAPPPPTPASSTATTTLPTDEIQRRINDSMRILLLVRSYQVRGHLLAKLDPLTGQPLWRGPEPPELQPSTYGFTEEDMDRPIYLGGDNLISGFLHSGSPHRTLREILQRLKETYCGSIAVEYMHIPDRKECNWIRERVETPQQYSFSPQQKFHILDRLTWGTMFERFLDTKYGNVKRFGLDGCESLIPGMKHMIDLAADLDIEAVVIGMPHRGRLNVLANVVRKPLEAILHEFNKDGDQAEDLGHGSGDVKYHLGTSYDRPTASGKKIHLSLLANPSHLEAVDPVVLGKARAKQEYAKDKEGARVMPVLLHGDAAFCGQGVVYETFDIGLWKDYTVGGTVHVVVNNQIGFTTDMKASRMPNASPYPTDVAKTAAAPIFHVNGDDPEAVVHAMRLAVEYRQAFKKDVVVDIVCYRKAGHNEIDEPGFTQPLMYEKIRQQTPTLEKYAAKLLEEGVVTEQGLQELKDKVLREYDGAMEASAQYVPSKMEWLSSYWSGYKSRKQLSKIRRTGLPKETLLKLAHGLLTLPEWLHAHKGVLRAYKKRRESIDAGRGIDWATAESLAFASLVAEGNLVRLCGQDVERGTFSQRHAVLHDVVDGRTYTPLEHVAEGQAPVHICNSPLSEFASMGFELGFSLENPNALVLWEAQFGDFANGAQVIIDQFLSSGEQKWSRQCGLVLLLPHGYDGQGPEHSSARLERFLQMSDSDPSVFPVMDETQRTQIQEANWQVVNCTTPANYFHLLRRQIHREFRKPLVVMTPKRLLRLAAATSPLDDFDDAGSFQRFNRVIPDVDSQLVAPEKVKRLVFCSGQVYYDLDEWRQQHGHHDVAIVRVEQLAPFPFDRIEDQAKLYPNAEIVWAQEEPMNMGAWTFVAPHIKTATRSSRAQPVEPLYVGRPVSAATATGSPKAHNKQLSEFLKKAFS